MTGAVSKSCTYEQSYIGSTSVENSNAVAVGAALVQARRQSTSRLLGCKPSKCRKHENANSFLALSVRLLSRTQWVMIKCTAKVQQIRSLRSRNIYYDSLKGSLKGAQPHYVPDGSRTERAWVPVFIPSSGETLPRNIPFSVKI